MEASSWMDCSPSAPRTHIVKEILREEGFDGIAIAKAEFMEPEARRLEALGAKRIQGVWDWLVMEAPTGQRFCLVKPQRADFSENANIWES